MPRELSTSWPTSSLALVILTTCSRRPPDTQQPFHSSNAKNFTGIHPSLIISFAMAPTDAERL
ncbi:hypothetical protein DFH28DRAFT_958899 [Melampsora americana]|nr:hypothetical protein DFH28DRAFT_958899 [Melampsora americana]